jgi:tetratricopeptide (TPR) repeat protein
LTAAVAAQNISVVDVSAAYGLLDLAEEVCRHAYAEDAAEWVAKLDARAEELPSAVDCLRSANDDLAALRLVAALRVFAQESGRVDEVRSLADDLLAQVDRSKPSTALAGVELVSGELAFRQGDQESAKRASMAARSIAKAVGDDATCARAEINLARVAFRDGSADRIAAHAEAALVLAGEDQRLRSGGLHMLGWSAYTAGDLDRATTLFEQNAELYGERGDLVGMGVELGNLGDLAMERADMPRAADLLGRALDIAVEQRSRYLLPSLLASVASFAGLAGSYAGALELAAAAESQYEQAGLTPDPSDGFNDGLRKAAVAAVGDLRAEELIRTGRDRTSEQAIALARSLLSDARPH